MQPLNALALALGIPVLLSSCGSSGSPTPAQDPDAGSHADADASPQPDADSDSHADADAAEAPSCESQCTVGQARCQGGQAQRCVDQNGCGHWDAPTDCENGLTCRAPGLCLSPTDMLLFVSPVGNDAWTGTLETPSGDGTDGPLATPAGARDKLRSLRAAGKVPTAARVLLRDGTYPLLTPLVFEPQDSGKPEAPVVFEDYPGDHPRLSGGRVITGWKVDAGKWTVDLPEVANGNWYFSALWFNGARRTRARSPNKGYFHTAGTVNPDAAHPDYGDRAFKFVPGDLQQFANLADAEVEVFHAWSTSRQRIASIDLTSHIIEFVAPDTTYEKFGPSQRYVVENVPEALDEPGEWYLDRTTGRLTCIPLPGESAASVQVVAPVASQLVLFNGLPEESKQVSDIQLRGLAVEYADWLVGPEGTRDGQAATVLNAAIEARHARRIVLENLDVAHANNYGVGWRDGSQECVLRHSELSDLGGGGVRIGEGDQTETHHNLVDNCFIHDAGKLLKGAVGVWIGRSSYNQVLHNEIADLFYSGVSVGWSWGYAATTAHDNLIAHNHIHHIGKGVLSDMGGVYTLGVSPGTRVLHNHIHDVMDFGYGGWGLYTDEGSSQIELSDNLVHSTHSAPFHQHYGEDNLVTNNILAFGREGQVRRSREHAEDQHSFDITRNIVVLNNGALLQGQWGNGLFTRDSNLYWDVTGRPVLFQCRTLQEVQATGVDALSKVADPLFVDALHFDFHLQQGSPALDVGFVPFALDDFGVYGDSAWIARPAQSSFGPSYLPESTPADWQEGFETTSPGSIPTGLRAEGTTPEAVIAVTEEQAFTGTRSLKVRDVVGLDPSWLPYFFFDRFVGSGTVTASFALRRSPGTRIYAELRDSRNPYVAGPSLHVAADGALIASGKPLGLTIPPDTWVTVSTKVPLSLQSGLYSLTVQTAGGSPQHFDGLGSPSQGMCNLSWMGFVAEGNTDGVVYVDDVGLTVQGD